MTAPGSRVFAIRDANEEVVYLFGVGVYAGDRRRPTSDAEVAELLEVAKDAIRSSDANPIDVSGYLDRLVAAGEMTRDDADAELAAGKARAAANRARPIGERAAELVERTLANPRIDLDDGSVVWGYQCWWAPEERLSEVVGDRRVVTVAPPS